MDSRFQWGSRVERWAGSPWAEWLLTLSAVIEAAIFPLSVDVPLIAMGVLRPKRALFYSFLVAFGSFLGGYIGYAIGYYFFPSLADPLIMYFGMEAKFQSVLSAYSSHSLIALGSAGFLPIPYITFTFAAGYHQSVPLLPFTIGAAIGRALRFYAVGVPLYLFGERAKGALMRARLVAVLIVLTILLVALTIGRWLQ